MTYVFLALSCGAVFLHRLFHFFNNTLFCSISKIIASSLFFIPGLINYLKLRNNSENFKKSGTLFFSGLFFAFLADIIIEFNFIAGFTFFFICHICYLCAFISLNKATPRYYFISLILLIVVITASSANPLVFYGNFFPFICIYIGLLCFVTTLSFSALKLESSYAILLALEGIIFLISDALLQLEIKDFSILSDKNRFIAGTVSNVFYYISQYLTVLALSKDIFKETKNEG